VPDQLAHHNPAPCALVDLKGGEARGYVILKDLRGIAQFLLIPTRRIAGIESADLLALDAPNYWAAAWESRRFMAARLKRDLAWDKVGLAINSSLARSQNQLHIHIDCVRPDVRSALAARIGEIGTAWAPLSFDLAGHRYFGRRLAAPDLAQQNPFKLLADGLPSARENMGQESLAVVGVVLAPGENGFVLLARRGDPAKGAGAHAEELLDLRCADARGN
jgi:CDP-diacylglycerol pyrophosphatase